MKIVKISLKFIWKNYELGMIKILIKDNKGGKVALLSIKDHYKVTVTKTI